MIGKSLALAGALSLFAGAALATPDTATYTLQINGFVPTVCKADLTASQVPSQAGVVALGQMREFCNDGDGYQVWVDYSPSLAGDTLTIGDRQIVLGPSGSAMIDASDGPGVAAKAVTLSLPQDGISGAVSVRVVSL